jgi:hypothetical protein
MIIKSLDLSDKGEVLKWDDFVKNHGQLYHDSRWADILRSVYSFEPLYLYAEEDKAIVSALPLFCIKKPFGGSEIVSVPHSDSSGLINTGPYRKYLDYLYEHVPAESIKIVQFMEPLGDLPANTSQVNITKDLPPTAAGIIDSVSDSQKRSHLRKSLEKSYEVVIGNDSELLSKFYELYLDKMCHFGTPPHPFSYFSAIREAFGDACTIIAAKDSKGVVVGAMLCIGYNRTLNSLWLAVLADHRKNLANYFIEYHAMEYSITNGYSSMNMGRSENKGSNYDFKVGMGGKPVPLYRYRFELASDGYH